MITGILAFVFFVAVLAAGNDGEWGAVAVGVVVILVLLALGAAGRTNARAYNNALHYWAEGGPERRKRR